MVRVVAIVEGHGEAEAVPLLIRRIGQEVSPLSTPDVVKPIRVPRGSMLKTGELDRYVSLAGIRVGSDGRILILLDAHRDCPAELRTTILERARATRSDLPIEVVLANREYESWFIAAVESLRGVRGISTDTDGPQDPESIQGAKEWLRDRMTGSYHPTADQAALTARFDLELARRRAPSFDKMWRAVSALLR